MPASCPHGAVCPTGAHAWRGRSHRGFAWPRCCGQVTRAPAWLLMSQPFTELKLLRVADLLNHVFFLLQSDGK